MIQAKRMLRQGYKAYLAHVVDTEKEPPKVEVAPVVSEFPDVFPDDLPDYLRIDRSSLLSS